MTRWWVIKALFLNHVISKSGKVKKPGSLRAVRLLLYRAVLLFRTGGEAYDIRGLLKSRTLLPLFYIE